MNLENYIGQVIRVKIVDKKESYYLAKEENESINVYIKDEPYYFEKELLGIYEKAIIVDSIENGLIGILLTNHKFEYDLNKIDKKLRRTPEYKDIKDIYLMERLKINGRMCGLYLVDEGNIGKYYLDDKEIGIYNKKIRQNNILFKEKTIEEEIKKQIRDIVKSIDLNKKEISLNEKRKNEKMQIENVLELGMGYQITKIATIDLKQKIKEYNKEDKQKEIVNTQFINEKKEATIKDVNIKQELETNDRLTDMKNLGQVLEKNGQLPNIEGKNFTKIGIIESDERDNLVDKNGNQAKANTTRYSFVAIASDGTVVPLEMEKDSSEGNNPRNNNYQVDHNGNVKQDDVLSRYKLGEGTLSIKNGKYGEIEVYHSPRKTLGGEGIEGNRSLDRQLETNNVWQMKKEERELAEEYGDGYRSVEEGYKEAKMHEEENGKILKNDKMEAKDVDGELETKSHSHDNVDYDMLATKWGYYKEGEPNYNKAKELFEEKRKENPEKDVKQIIEMITEELEEEIRN